MGGGGGGAKAKIKIEQGKQKKKIRAPEKFEEKNSCRLFNREKNRAYQRYSVRVAPKFGK